MFSHRRDRRFRICSSENFSTNKETEGRRAATNLNVFPSAVVRYKTLAAAPAGRGGNELHLISCPSSTSISITSDGCDSPIASPVVRTRKKVKMLPTTLGAEQNSPCFISMWEAYVIASLYVPFFSPVSEVVS